MLLGGTRVRADFNNLRKRMDERLYPENMQVLALYWLKTVWNKGYTRDDWNALDRLLQRILRDDTDPHRRAAFEDLRTWIRDKSVRSGNDGTSIPKRQSRHEPSNTAALRAYVARMMNDWVPKEVARLLVEEPENGIPATAIGRAIERLLLREGLGAETLHSLLEPGLMSPRLMFPADYEILGDVVLYLLSRTEASARPIMPAALLFIAPGAHLSPDYAAAVERAEFIEGPETEELHVPIGLSETMEALAPDELRITSRIVTMDGRWWEAGKLRGGVDTNFVVYRPAGRVRIDYSHEHARIQVRWPEARYHWSGETHFETVMHVFGREWKIGRWEQDADGTWVDLVFTRWLRPEEMHLEAEPPRSRPASVDLAWAALEDALKQPELIEKLRREELIPLARSLEALVEAVSGPGRNLSMIQARLNAAAFFAAAFQPSCGKIRWTVLPERVRKTLTAPRVYPSVSDSLRQVFEDLPEVPMAKGKPTQSTRWLRKLVEVASSPVTQFIK